MNIEITTKAKANRIIVDSLFTPGGTLDVIRYSMGKYKWTGSQSHYVGREVDDLGGRAKAVWVERREDEHGPYAAFFCAFKQ